MLQIFPVQPSDNQVQADLAPLREDAFDNIPGCVLLGPPHQRSRRDALQPPEILQPRQERDTCVHIPEDSLRGLLGSTTSSQVSREQKQKYLKWLTDKNDSVCLQETHGKDDFLKAFQILHPQFRMFGTFIPNNVNAGGSAVLIRGNLLPEDVVVTHEITCQGRDHIVRTRSGESVLVVINVHFEPHFILRDLRERLRRIVFHWPRCPEGFGMIIGDFNIFDPEEGRFSLGNRTVTEGNAGKTALLRAFFPTCS